ncbi:MAG: VCBS repeat-containing protein [Acidobacteria bacterium]|nr:VCBS repeat-containing protein [Acidobacteriota bacterium]
MSAMLSWPVVAAPGNFVPDWTFTGTDLSAWQRMGDADWRVEQGDIVGVSRGASGGWLVLERSLQDLHVAVSFRCQGACEAGAAVRLEQTPQGYKGLMVRFAGVDPGLYAVVLDPQGHETSRAALQPSGGNFRLSPGVAPNPWGPPGPMPGGVPSPYAPLPPAAAVTGEWNDAEVVVDANILRTFMNKLRGAGGTADEAFGAFGRIALYVGGAGEVRFRGVALKDLARRMTPPEITGDGFRTQKIEDFYTAWSAAAGDFNRDGVLDVAAGHRYYLGPSFTESREIYLAQPFNPAKEYAPGMINVAFDYTGDGWDDVLITEGRTPVLHVNPRGESRRWDRYAVFPPVTSETIVFRDVDGDRRPDGVFVGSDVVGYASVDPARPTAPWQFRAVSAKGPWPIHGVGVGDIDGDGRLDILTPYGWWAQPATDTGRPWAYSPARLGRTGPPWGPGGSEMSVYDVNGDGLNDVVTSLAAHGWGLAWYEQRRDAAGARTFVEHMIMDDFSTKNAGGVTFSELHGSTAADMDGDRVPDLVVGKRHWSHLESYSDPDPNGPGVLYWYRTVRNPKAPGGAEFVPHLVHNRSGAGSTVTVVDLNRDGLPDVLTGTTRGTFVFWGTRRR